MKRRPRVLVFCSSSQALSPIYFGEVEQFARLIGEHKMDIVFGGSNAGLMGHLALHAKKAGAKVYGVVPEILNTPYSIVDGLTELHVVDSLLDRKRKMLSMSDAVVVLPGGLGTLDEATEVLALKQLGETKVPVCFYNYLDFWSPFIGFLEELTHRQMITASTQDLFEVLDGAQLVVDYILEQTSRDSSVVHGH